MEKRALDTRRVTRKEKWLIGAVHIVLETLNASFCVAYKKQKVLCNSAANNGRSYALTQVEATGLKSYLWLVLFVAVERS